MKQSWCDNPNVLQAYTETFTECNNLQPSVLLPPTEALYAMVRYYSQLLNFHIRDSLVESDTRYRLFRESQESILLYNVRIV